MNTASSQELQTRKCKPCEGGVEPYSQGQARSQLNELGHWELAEDGKSISRRWKLKGFRQALQLLNKCAEIAESDQHHPDLHLTGYRLLQVDLTTHAIDGLSENDFILAAKIDAVAAECTE